MTDERTDKPPTAPIPFYEYGQLTVCNDCSQTTSGACWLHSWRSWHPWRVVVSRGGAS